MGYKVLNKVRERGTFSVITVYKRVRSCASVWSLLVWNFVEFPPGHKLVSIVQDSRFNRTKQSLFDLNLFINIKVMYIAPPVIFSVFSFCLFCFFFFRKGSPCSNLEWVQKYFPYIAAMLWNSLCANIRGVQGIDDFKKALRNYMF